MTLFEIGILPNRPIRESMDWVKHAEAVGFDGVWVADSQSIFRDAFAALAAYAVTTERMRLATGVTNAVTRHPAVLAGSFVSLDELSGGRVVMGFGVGASAVRTLGLKPSRLAELEASIAAIRALTAGEPTAWDGQLIRLPWAQRELPVVISCSGPKSLRMAGRIADGVMFQVGSHPELIAWAIERVRAGAAEAGRNSDEVALHARLGCVVSADAQAARDQLRGYGAVAAVTIAESIPEENVPESVRADLSTLLAQYDWTEHSSPDAPHVTLLTDPLLDAVGVAGTPDEVAERLQQLVDVGVDGFVIPITVDDPGEQIGLLAGEVIPGVGQ